MIEDPPLVPQGATHQLSERVHVIPDQRIEFVPNAGIVAGERATLVIDTAMGPRNGERILTEARRVGGDRKLLLTTTHFHPEHAFGAQSFADVATYVCNAAQTEEMVSKGPEYLEMFSGFGPGLAQLLADVELITPDVTYSGDRAVIDLGGVEVWLLAVGPAHTRGDQVVFLPHERVLFAGDLVEERFLPIFADADANGSKWLAVLDELEALAAAVVVGGHGAVGGTELISSLRDYLVTVRDQVGALHAEGCSLAEIERELDTEFAERQADWGNQVWIKSAIDSFHSELAG